MIRSKVSRSALLFPSVLLIAGCRMGAPVHVWEPPQLESAVGKKVVVSAVAGPDQIADDVKQKLLEQAPTDQGRETILVDAAGLQAKSEIQLVSASDAEPNDVALASVARKDGADFLLRGEVITDRTKVPIQSDEDRTLKISWRLTALDMIHPGGGSPVVVDVKSAIDRYPDLALASNYDEVLATAAVRDTYRLIAPSVTRDRVQLAIPYVLPGSRDVRRGNAAARAGQWGKAEAIWQAVIERHPKFAAALHNLSLAAAAGQDFSRAKQLARKAIRIQPTGLHQQTLVWVELKQRAYHEAFNLPDPPEGWFVTESPSEMKVIQH